MLLKFDNENGKNSFYFEAFPDVDMSKWFFAILRTHYNASIVNIMDHKWEILIGDQKLHYYNDDLMPDALYALEPSANDLVEKIGLDLEERLKAEMSKEKEI